jgi:hypothetical protein
MAQLNQQQWEQVCALSSASTECPESDELTTLTIIACDNLITRDKRQWSAEILSQAAEESTGLIGKPFTLDHDWDEVDKVQGVIYDAELLDLPEAPPNIVNTWYSKINKKIIKEEGYRPLIVRVAFYRYGGVTFGQALGSLRYVSFGGQGDLELFCPHDGLNFSDPACPYLPPSRWYEPTAEELKARNLKMADYAVYKGSIWFNELSQVLVPNLPGAQVISRSIAKYYPGVL